MSRTAAPIVLAPEERSTLETWSRARRLPLRLIQRAQIIRLAADGVLSQEIAHRLRVSRPTVRLWRQRFLALRVPGLEKDAPRPGRLPRITVRKIRAVVEATLHTTPPQATHWSTRSMARAQGLSEATIRRIWRRHNLKPHLVETFKLSRDKQFVEKLQDVVGLYLNPPDKALVLCVDEKSPIQALDRTQPLLPLRPGIPARQTYDYKRHGTTTLFAALSMLDGTVIGDCMPRHRHQEFIRFLKRIDTEPPGIAPDRRQLWDAQTSTGQLLGETPSAVPSPLYPYVQFLGESHRTVVPRAHRQAYPAWYLPQRARLDYGHQSVHGAS